MRIEHDNGSARNGHADDSVAAQIGVDAAGAPENGNGVYHANGNAPALQRRAELARVLASPVSVRADDEDDDVVDVSQIGAMLRRRRLAMLVTFLSVLALGAIYTMLQRPVYQATATILVSTPGGSDAASNLGPLQGILTGGAPSRTLGTQMEILRSTPLQNGALQRLTPVARFEAQQFRQVNVYPLRDAEVIAVEVRGHDRTMALSLANAICAEYMAQNAMQSRDQVLGATRYVQDQLGPARERLDQASKALRAFREKNGSVNLDEEVSAQVGKVNQIEADSRATQAENAASTAQLRDLRAQIAGIKDGQLVPTGIVRRPEVETLKASLTQLELQRVAARRELTPQSRTVRNLDGQIAIIQQRLRREAQTEAASWVKNVDPVRQAILLDAARIQGQIWGQESRLGALQSALQSAQQKKAELPAQAYQLGQLTTEQNVLQKAYETLNDRYQSLRISEEARVSNNRVLSVAEATPGPISPRKGINLGLATLFGLLLALAVAALLDRADGRAHSPAEIEGLTLLPVLASVADHGKTQPLLATPNGVDAQQPALLDSYRTLRSALSFAALHEPIRSLAVTSPGATQNKAAAAINLAVALALVGKRVVLVDCDLRHPTLHTLLQLDGESGLSDVLCGRVALENALRESGVPRLRVLAGGGAAPYAVELLESPALHDCLNQLSTIADYVVLHASPALGAPDAALVAAAADATILVVSVQRDQKHDIARAADKLAQSHSHLLGTLLVTTENDEPESVDDAARDDAGSRSLGVRLQEGVAAKMARR